MSRPIDFPCESCGAQPGQRCTTASGRPYTGPQCAHASRRLLSGKPTPMPRQLSGRLGGLTSWANTPDRTARTQRSRDAGPGSIDYWLAKLDQERFADATDEQRRAAAQAAKSAFYARLAAKSAVTRARKAANRRTAR